MNPQNPSPPGGIEHFAAVYTRALYLTDDDGTTRGTLTVTGDGSPTLTLQDPGGTPRVCARVEADGAPVIFLADGSGRQRLSLTIATNGFIVVKMADHALHRRLVLGVLPDGQPYISVYGSEGEILWGFPMQAPSTRTEVEELLTLARANNREGFRVACERAGLDVDDPEIGWEALRALAAREPMPPPAEPTP